ncbi:MAG: hypothetical protein U7123_11390 [Potamolinea sp.]
MKVESLENGVAFKNLPVRNWKSLSLMIGTAISEIGNLKDTHLLYNHLTYFC